MREPVVLLFHTLEPVYRYYQDGFDDTGIYLYSGQGVSGDMQWNAANRAIRDHGAQGRSLFLFERFRRNGGFWQLKYQMVCVGIREVNSVDRYGAERLAIVFELAPVSNAQDSVEDIATSTDLNRLRALATDSANPNASTYERLQIFRTRSAAIRAYALARAGGLCEACHRPAPFVSASGFPYLEVHHLFRLADGGPDHPTAVSAICPNCHRRCHYSSDSIKFNMELASEIAAKEQSLLRLKKQ